MRVVCVCVRRPGTIGAKVLRESGCVGGQVAARASEQENEWLAGWMAGS